MRGFLRNISLFFLLGATLPGCDYLRTEPTVMHGKEGKGLEQKQIAYLERFLQGRDDPYVHFLVGERYFEIGNYKKARFHANQCLKLEPTNRHYQFFMARVLDHADEANEAMLSLEKAESYGLEGLSLCQLGLKLAIKIKDPTRAQHYLLKLEDLDHHQSDLMLFKGKIALMGYDTSNALKYFRAAHDAHHPSMEVYTHMVSIYTEKGDREKAKALSTEGLRLAPENQLFLLTLADIALQDVQLDTVFMYYKKVLDLNPKNPQAAVGMAELRSLEGKFEEVIKVLDPVLKAHQGHQKGLRLRGDAFFALRKYGEARADYERLLKVAPAEPHATRQIARIEWRIKNGFAATGT